MIGFKVLKNKRKIIKIKVANKPISTRCSPSGVEMSVGLEQTPQIAVVGDGVFQDGGRQQGFLIGWHALHHDLFQQILQASGQVNSGVTVYKVMMMSRCFPVSLPSLVQK
jgi:hypothetical protein